MSLADGTGRCAAIFWFFHEVMRVAEPREASYTPIHSPFFTPRRPLVMSDTDPGPQIQVDSDWKAQAQREKQKLAEKEKAAREPAPNKPSPRAGGAAASNSRFPDADFAGLTNMMVSQALMAMGAMAHPQTGQPHVDLGLARHMIDLLGVVEDKTKGNLTEDEAKQLASTLYELRSSYVQIANASRSPATGGQGGL